MFCFPQSVASTRFMIQDEMRLETTKCDNCIIGTMIALQVRGSYCFSIWQKCHNLPGQLIPHCTSSRISLARCYREWVEMWWRQSVSVERDGWVGGVGGEGRYRTGAESHLRVRPASFTPSAQLPNTALPLHAVRGMRLPHRGLHHRQ